MDEQTERRMMQTMKQVQEQQEMIEKLKAVVENQQKLIEALTNQQQPLAQPQYPPQAQPQQILPTQPPKMRLPFPDSFAGRQGDDPRLWCSKVRSYAEYYEQGDAEAILLATQRLTGPAEVWWNSYKLTTSEQGCLQTFAEFANHLVAACNPVNEEYQARQDLWKLSQTNTVVEYVTKFKQLQLKIPTLGKEDALDRFIRGLKPGIRLRVLQMQCTSIEQAAQVAAIQENFLIDNPEPQLSTPAATNEPTPMELDAIQGRRNQFGYRGGRGRRGPGRGGFSRVPLSEIECFNCHQKGHRAVDCPNNSNDCPNNSNGQ